MEAGEPMPTDLFYTDTQKLIRCTIVGRDSVPGVRFVELENFQLWRYMMEHRHGFRLTNLALGLWVNEEQFRQRQDLYARAGELEKVTKIALFIIDDIHHYCHSVIRYALAEDAAALGNILLSHLPEALRRSDRFAMDTYPGYCIEKQKTLDPNSFVLGLSSP